MNNIYKKNVRVLVIEPSNQGPTFEKARPNGNLGPAYIVGSLRKHGIEVDYLDAIYLRKINKGWCFLVPPHGLEPRTY